MVPINKSNDDAEAASNAGPRTMIEDGITSGSGTSAGSQPRIMAEQSLNEYQILHNNCSSTTNVIIDIPNQPNIPGEGAPEDDTMFVTIIAMLVMTASGLGRLEIVWLMSVLQGGFAFTLKKKDFVFVTVTLLFGGIRIICSSPKHKMQQLVLFYWFQLVSAMITAVLSTIQLSSQDFSQTEEVYKVNWDFALNFFYVVALAEALVLLAWCYLLRRPFGNGR